MPRRPSPGPPNNPKPRPMGRAALCSVAGRAVERDVEGKRISAKGTGDQDPCAIQHVGRGRDEQVNERELDDPHVRGSTRWTRHPGGVVARSLTGRDPTAIGLDDRLEPRRGGCPGRHPSRLRAVADLPRRGGGPRESGIGPSSGRFRPNTHRQTLMVSRGHEPPPCRTFRAPPTPSGRWPRSPGALTDAEVRQRRRRIGRSSPRTAIPPLPGVDPPRGGPSGRLGSGPSAASVDGRAAPR